MKHIILIVSLLMGVTLGVQAQPKALFDKTTHEFGTILWKNPVTATFKITNKGDKPLVLSNLNISVDKIEMNEQTVKQEHYAEKKHDDNHDQKIILHDIQ